MAIKNRDGTVYQVQRPNPIMMTQSLWSKDETAIMHNKFGKKVRLSKPQEVIKEEKKVAEKKVKEPEPDYTDIWCLPAFYEVKEDPLYGTSHSVIKYGAKFQFKGIVLNSEDLFITLIYKDEIPDGSVLFPRNKDRRWWRVAKSEKLGDGNYVITGLPSDYQPSFS